MTLTSSDIHVPLRTAPAAFGTVWTWFATEKERRRARREMRDLSGLPDHLLRDMGLEHAIRPRGPQIHAYWP